MTTDRPQGRIITFYSYKGGTGRSMAVANVAWILASNGKRVLVIDWDFEAPGLHRFFRPFLKDKELVSSPGLIDFFIEFTVAARVAHLPANEAGTKGWYEPHTNMLQHAYSLEWEFPQDRTSGSQGTIDFVPAGQQGPSYAVNVTTFDWRVFYEKLGGGVFLEAVKKELRRNYDFILIDSRTGISDTAGICTVQMPDEIVVSFTLNRQSINGASAVMISAESQRIRATGEPSLRVWPVPSRVELAEKEQLDTALDFAHEKFQRFLRHLTRTERSEYWRRVQVLYQPYFAYHEVLATFADRRGRPNSMLTSMEMIASYINRSAIELGPMSEPDRLKGLESFAYPSVKSISTTTPRQVFLSYTHDNTQLAAQLVAALRKHEIVVWWDEESLLPGDAWRAKQELAIKSSAALVVLMSTMPNQWQTLDIALALRTNKRIVPVLSPGTRVEVLPPLLIDYVTTAIRGNSIETDIAKLARGLAEVLNTQTSDLLQIDSDDPQKGLWGGQPSQNGRDLSATVREVSEGWFEVVLIASASSTGAAISGPIEFHLHPTFGESPIIVEPKKGKAKLQLFAWGAFTVGAVCDGGKTRLELDLSENQSFPKTFRER